MMLKCERTYGNGSRQMKLIIRNRRRSCYLGMQ